MKMLMPNFSSSVQDEGYNAGWLGLDRANPYPIGTANHRAWDIGYQDALDDAVELISIYSKWSNYDDELTMA